MQPIRSQKNWKSPRPYSAGVVVGDMVFLSGHVPVDEDGATLGTDTGEQAAVVLANLDRTLHAGGLTRESLVSTTAYLTDMAEIDGLDRAYRDYFGPDGSYPTRTTVQISSLGRAEFAVEISAIAVAAARARA